MIPFCSRPRCPGGHGSWKRAGWNPAVPFILPGKDLPPGRLSASRALKMSAEKARTVSKGPREDRKGDRTLSDADPLLPEFPYFLIRRVQVPVHVGTRLNSLIRKRTSRTLRKEARSWPEYVLFYHEFPIKKEPCAKFFPDQESRSASGYEPVRPKLTVRFSQTFFLPL